MRLSPQRFNRFLNNIGQQFLWRRSYACSCVSLESGAPSPKCPVCLGKGHFWTEPKQCSAASAGQKVQVVWAQMGQYQSGDLVMTVPENSPLWGAGLFDRVTMLNATDPFSQPMRRGAPTEKLLFTPKTIDRVFWISPNTQQIVDGGIPVFDANGRPTWTAGEPPPGMQYSITGTRLSEYFLFQEMPRNRAMHDGARLPKLMVLRRWDLLGR